MNEFLTYIIPIVAAALGVPIAEALQKGIKYVDDLPPSVKRILVALFVYGLNFAGVKVGAWTGFIQLDSVTAEHITSLLSSGLAYLFHGQDAAKAAKAGH